MNFLKENLFAFRFLSPFALANVNQYNHRPINLILHSPVGSYSHGVPTTIATLNLLFFNSDSFNHVRNQLLQIRDVNIEIDIADGASNVSGNQIEYLFRYRSETPDTQIASHHDYRHIDTAQQVI